MTNNYTTAALCWVCDALLAEGQKDVCSAACRAHDEDRYVEEPVALDYAEHDAHGCGGHTEPTCSVCGTEVEQEGYFCDNCEAAADAVAERTCVVHGNFTGGGAFCGHGCREEYEELAG